MLYIVATPIGNLEDLSRRAEAILRSVDVIACEDTRRTRKLLSHYSIPRPTHLVSYRQGREQSSGTRLLEFLDRGLTVALCSDGGYPGISDPGYRLVREAVQRGVDCQAIPGASAVATALVVSGLSTSSYTFKGYAPRKGGALRRFFEEDRDLPHTLVVFESPYRVGVMLQAAAEVLGDREAAVCMELTKKFERVVRGHLCDLAAELRDMKVKGEITVVISGNNPKFTRHRVDENQESLHVG